MADDNNIASNASINYGAWIYVAEKNTETCEILSRLVLTAPGHEVAIGPMLLDVTVEANFEPTVKCPMLLNDGTVILRLANFMPCTLFLNSADDLRLCEDVVGNVDEICEEAAARYHYSGGDRGATADGAGETSAAVASEGGRGKSPRTVTTASDVCGRVNASEEDSFVYIVCTYGFRELLYHGYLVPHWQETSEVSVGNRRAVKIPLASPFMFTQCRDDHVDIADPFVLENGFYHRGLADALFSFLFRPVAVSLRYHDVQNFISASLDQYVNDTYANAKICDRKVYTCHGNNKLSNSDKDTLALCDGVANEVVLSYLTQFLDSAYDAPNSMDFFSWPAVKDKSHEEVLRQLDDLMMHMTVHVSALVFSGNSVLYQNRICKSMGGTGSSESKDESSIEALLKTVHHGNGIQLLYEDGYDDSKCMVRPHTPKPKNNKYNLDHLAFAASFSPHVLTKLVWVLNRCEEYKTTQSASSVCYLVLNSSSTGTCLHCDGKHCNTCVGGLMCRMGTRFPNVNRPPRKEPCVTTLLTRQFADMSLLGSFGKRYNADRDQAGAKDGRGAAVEPLDKTKYFLNVLDYCKRESLIDVEGNDIMQISGKADFVKIMSGLNRTIDEELVKLLGDMRKHVTAKDDLANSTLSFTLDLNPLGYGFAPLLQFVHVKTLVNILESLALVVAIEKITSYPLTQASYAKWIRQHYQSIYGEFKKSVAKKGFMTLSDYKVKNASFSDTFPDFNYVKREYANAAGGAQQQQCLPTTTYQCRLWSFNFTSLRDVRIKYKPVPRNKESPYFQKPERGVQNPVSGPLSFLVTRFHKDLFPNVTVSPMTLWQRIYMNTLKNFNVDLGDKAEVEQFIRFMFEQTIEWEASNCIDAKPDSLVQYVEFRLTNRLLHASGQRGQYIGTVQALSTVLSEAKLEGFPCYIEPEKSFYSVSDYYDYCRGQNRPVTVGRTRPYGNTNGMFENRPLVTVPYALEKYPGASGNANIFHCGQLGYYSGSGVDRNLGVMSKNSDYNFMRKKHVLCTPMTNVIYTKMNRGVQVFDFDMLKQRVGALLAEQQHSSGCDLEVVVLNEILKTVKEPSYNDLLFLTDYQEHLANDLFEKIKLLDELEVASPYTLETLQEVFQEKAEPNPSTTSGLSYDFSSIIPKASDVEDCGGMMGGGASGMIHDFGGGVEDEPILKRMRL
ncbi:major DNA binding protein [Elephant endotheliotropic herpesvirus 3B]|nr:major DNA binding protein [Elephant endotheliotropic herpesvirus 3B]